LTRETGKKYEIQYLVLELIKFGELFDYIFFPQKGFGEEIGKYIFTQLIEGLDACHKTGTVHRDMKTENIMLGEGWQMKIADFGFSTKTEGKKGNGLLYTALGTASYASPELLQKKPYLGVPSDIFSLGVSLFVLVTGKMPFKHALVDDPYYKELVKTNYDAYWKKLDTKVPEVSKEFKQLFVKLIAYDPTTRPSLDECRKCDWLKNYKPDSEKINNEFVERTKLVQQKKEIERKKEEEQERTGVLKSYKNGSTEEDVSNTSNDLEISMIEEEDDTYNPYTLRFKGEENPGELLDYVQKKNFLNYHA
jgi:serine/threonine protein kinase